MPRRLDRRTVLRGTGVALALPFLDAMADAKSVKSPPRRFCGVYFPYGVGLPAEDSEHAEWRWFPNGSGRDFQFTRTLDILEPVREDVTILKGLSHPACRDAGGHDTGDTFLTGVALEGKFLKNGVSVDQVAAKALGKHTRYSSLVLSTDGGVGEPSRASTLSFSENGHPIPAMNSPRTIFDRLFGAGGDNLDEQRRRLGSSVSLLDRVLDQSRALRRDLGAEDQVKLDEYLESVRQVEQRVERSQAWLEIPRPELTDEDRERLRLNADDSAPKEYMRTMYELIYLAFRTDQTRLATYQIGSMGDFSSKAGKFPQLLGFKNTLHRLAHEWNKDEGAVNLGRWDRFMAGELGRLIARMRETPEGDGTLMDHTLIFYGSSNSQTHNNSNYPLILAGGRGLGLQPGRLLELGEDVPLANLFATVLDRLEVPTTGFADSTGEMSELYG